LALSKFTAGETRFGMLQGIAPARADAFAESAQTALKTRYALYQHLAAPTGAPTPPPAAPATPAAS
jgi:hypothetical protein